jgi:biopolymer transport protein ExbD
MGVNLTPMIDVVFQLLIYFLLATNFALGEQVFRLDLPDRSGTSDNVDPFELIDEPLRIRVDSTGPDGNSMSISLEGPFPQPGNLEELEQFLEGSRTGGGSGIFLEDHPVDIVPTPTTRWEHVVDVFNAVVRAGYTKVQFASPE